MFRIFSIEDFLSTLITFQLYRWENAPRTNVDTMPLVKLPIAVISYGYEKFEIICYGEGVAKLHIALLVKTFFVCGAAMITKIIFLYIQGLVVLYIYQNDDEKRQWQQC